MKGCAEAVRFSLIRPGRLHEGRCSQVPESMATERLETRISTPSTVRPSRGINQYEPECHKRISSFPFGKLRENFPTTIDDGDIIHRPLEQRRIRTPDCQKSSRLDQVATGDLKSISKESLPVERTRKTYAPVTLS